MEIVGDYHQDGFAHVRRFVPQEVARAFMTRFKGATDHQPIPLSKPQMYPGVLARPAFDVSTKIFPAMDFFLWGLTPAVSQIVGRDVLPTYVYFRIYRENDVCFVHSDRPSSEHGLSLTLDYSDGEPWDLQIGHERTETLYPLSKDFGSEEYSSIAMQVGDAVLYQASHYPHGRIKPNPNAWSAHLFLFYVDRDGEHQEWAFDKEINLEPVNFSFV